jgi:hypothetical protein
MLPMRTPMPTGSIGQCLRPRVIMRSAERRSKSGTGPRISHFITILGPSCSVASAIKQFHYVGRDRRGRSRAVPSLLTRSPSRCRKTSHFPDTLRLRKPSRIGRRSSQEEDRRPMR